MKRKIKILADIAMTIILILLMSYSIAGEKIHEWLGISMALLVILHNVLNFNWWKNVRKWKYNIFRIVQTSLTVLTLLTVVCLAASGILMSRYVLKSVSIIGASFWARKIHMLCAYWGFVFMSLHIGFHWRMITGKMMKKLPSALNIITKISGFAFSAYGLYAFFKRKIPDYLFMRSSFAFFDKSESLILFILDYTAVMGPFVCAGHYISKYLIKISSSN